MVYHFITHPFSWMTNKAICCLQYRDVPNLPFSPEHLSEVELFIHRNDDLG